MENWAAEVQHHAPPVDPYSHHIQYASYQHSLNPNPNPNPNQGLRPLGLTLALLLARWPIATSVHTIPVWPMFITRRRSMPLDIIRIQNAVNALQNWAAEVLRFHGSNANATGVNNFSKWDKKQSVRPHARINALGGNSTWKRTLPKKTKIAQSAWCEVCKIECNSKDVLDQHKMGKKHQKNMEKLNQAIAPPCVTSSGVSVNPVIGPQANPDKGKATRKKAAEPVEDLEAKRQKIMEGGAAADAVRLCTQFVMWFVIANWFSHITWPGRNMLP
ncbi:hypothetical protein Acr_05g0006310 [Actinidia rufa]|uniref:U1-type domain-containing protein n=1 Tax=Actinidia rufa TaxID=165716 RepID=A0A7J0EL18_9ERIC|nr:hypothetical protein Acr_05g0006310 [Actinidia rufa]